MSSILSQQIDRLSFITKAVSTAADETSPRRALPFTSAVLQTSLGNLIRDIDPSELGLFNLVKPQDQLAPTHDPQIERVEFTGATPLKRPHVHRDPQTKPSEVPEPEAFALAALKYIERYQSIRPMPRAHSQAESIIERLAAVRASLSALADTLRQVETASQPSTKCLLDEEQLRVEALQERLAVLKQQKQKLTPARRLSQPKLKKCNPDPLVKADAQENEFWTTPTAAARAMRFTGAPDNLMDEQVDLPDTSMLSLLSPSLPQLASPLNSPSPPGHGPENEHALRKGDDDDSQSSILPPIYNLDAPLAQNQDSQFADESLPLPPEGGIVDSQVPKAQSISPSKLASLINSDTPVRQPKLKVTSEMERIVAKIWSTVGDIIMPGHSYTTEPLTGDVKYPRAKETIANLQIVSNQTLQLSSPSATSLSTLASSPALGPTPQQILTAHLLLQLLSAQPSFSVPLNVAKDSLAAKSKGLGISVANQGTTRILYGCVAKRLIKIERGRGEQVVKFDLQL